MGHKFEERNQVTLFSKNNIGELKTSKHLKFMMLCFVKTIISWWPKCLSAGGGGGDIIKYIVELSMIIIEDSQRW